jgi:aspartyl-tRNA synthetase
MAFPKNQRGSDLMLQAPSAVDDAQLAEVGLALKPAIPALA